MLTSDTMSILAMSMLMPTSTGAPMEMTTDYSVSIATADSRVCCMNTDEFYPQNQVADGCHSPSTACPRWLSHMTCYWAHWRWGRRTILEKLSIFLGTFLTQWHMPLLSDLTFAPRRLQSPVGTDSRPPSIRGPKHSTSPTLSLPTTLTQDLRDATYAAKLFEEQRMRVVFPT